MRENTFHANLILILGIFTFIVITIDLQTEMAIEKDEISSIVFILEQTIDTTLLNKPLILNLDFQFVGIIPETFTHRIFNEVFTCLQDRAPPSLI